MLMEYLSGKAILFIITEPYNWKKPQYSLNIHTHTHTHTHTHIRTNDLFPVLHRWLEAEWSLKILEQDLVSYWNSLGPVLRTWICVLTFLGNLREKLFHFFPYVHALSMFSCVCVCVCARARVCVFSYCPSLNSV